MRAGSHAVPGEGLAAVRLRHGSAHPHRGECSFWYVEALTRAGRPDEARLAFEKMLTYGNHLGLHAEQISRAGEQQGNFPQALTHLALISAAFNLDRALG